MARKVASFRLDTDLLDWVGAYAKTRGASQGTLVEEAVRHFKALSEGGVPDLPVVDTPVVRQQRAALGRPSALPGGDAKDWAAARQVKLNEAKARASR